MRIGTLDNPDALPPDVHVCTASKQPWVVLPDGARGFEDIYDREAEWCQSSLARLEVLRPRIEAYRASFAPVGA